MTPEAGVLVMDLPPEWFEEAQRAIAALRKRLEEAEREIARKEYDLELRERVLEERERLSEAVSQADSASAELEQRARALNEEARRIEERQDAVERETEALSARRHEIDAFEEAMRTREQALRTLEQDLVARRASLEQSQVELEAARQGVVSRTASMEGFDREREVADESPSPRGSDEPLVLLNETAMQDELRRLMALREMMEWAAESLGAREAQARSMLADAAQQAKRVEGLEGQMKVEESRLAALRAEIVNAKEALLVVDSAITKLPYDVVDDFTRSDAFETYEHAIKTLRRSPE